MPRQYRRDRDSDPDLPYHDPYQRHDNHDNDRYDNNHNNDYEYDSNDEDLTRDTDYKPNFGFNSRLPYNLRGFVPVWDDPDGYDEHDVYGNDNDNNGHDGQGYGYNTRRSVGPEESAAKHQSADSSNSAAHLLAGQYQAEDRGNPDDGLRSGKRRSQRKQALLGGLGLGAGAAAQDITRDRPKGRIVSGAHLEEGRGQVRQRSGAFPASGGGDGGGAGPGEELLRKEGNWNGSTVSSTKVDRPFYKRKRWWLGMAILLLILAAIAVPVAVVMTRKHTNNKHTTSADSNTNSDSDDNAPANLNLKGISRDSIPSSAQGTVLDPFTWYDTTDFNVTYTNHTVGGLPLIGLNSTWDDTAQANEHVPPLNESFPYGTQPIRGVNLGGWLSIEPFIVPSFFDKYDDWEGIVDEYTLTQRLGDSANATLEKHYAKFITEQDFADIRDAGLDHVRIQYSYWAIKTFDNEPYVSQIAWRYLLRAIEYCRKYGLRVNLDLHGLVGSQNGWNHSGREGAIGWLNGTDGSLNRKRSLELHDSLSKFFAQDRYRNIVTIYGLVNEPLMLELPIKDVLEWTTEVTKLVQGNNITAWISFHDGFLNLSKWKKMLKGDDVPDNLLLDTHQYTIFNTGQIVLKHADRVNLICNDWWHMIREINTTDAGYLPPLPRTYLSLLIFIAEAMLISYNIGGALQSAANGPQPTPTARPTSTTSAAAPAGKEPFPLAIPHNTVRQPTVRNARVQTQTQTQPRIVMDIRSSCRRMRRRR